MKNSRILLLLALLFISTTSYGAVPPIFSDLFTTITTPLEGSITNTSSTVANAIKPTATTLFLIYVCFWAWALARGMIQEPILDGTQRIIRWGLIYAIGLIAVHYTTFVINFFWNTPDAMATIIVGSLPSSNISHMSTTNFLDSLLLAFITYFNMWWEAAFKSANKLGIPNIGYLLIACLVIVTGLALLCVAAFLVLLSKVAMAVLLGIGPAAIIMLFFQNTSKIFDAWLGQLLNYMLVGILISVVLAIVGGPLYAEIKPVAQAYLQGNTTGDPDRDKALIIVAFSMISTFFMFLIPGISSAIGGGVALQTMGAVGWAYARAKGVVGGTAREATGRAHNDRMMRRAQVARAREYNRKNPGLMRRAANATGAKISSAVRRGNTVKKA